MFQISLAQPSDIPVIQNIAYTVWKPTYGEILSEEQSRFMLDWMYSATTLRQSMEGNTVFLLGKAEQTTMGFAAFEPLQGGIVKLHKLYLLPISQGRGYGRLLLDEVAARAVQVGGHYLELNVNRSNSARQFYEKLGFEMAREEDNYIGNGYWMNDYVMRKKLQ